MKFIHTSDWHIGRQFHNVSLLEDQQYVLDQLIQYLEQYDIDALVISGDIYDRSVPPAQAVSLLDTTLSKICLDLKIPVILISGNHDSTGLLPTESLPLNPLRIDVLRSRLGSSISIQTSLLLQRSQESDRPLGSYK